MRIVRVLLLLLTVVCGNLIQGRNSYKNSKYWQYFLNDNQGVCVQEKGKQDCETCLKKSQDCYWCSSDGGSDVGECRSSKTCPGANFQMRICRKLTGNAMDYTNQGYKSRDFPQKYRNSYQVRVHEDKIQPYRYNNDLQNRENRNRIKPQKAENYEKQLQEIKNENQPRKYKYESHSNRYLYNTHFRKPNNPEIQPRVHQQDNDQPQKLKHENQPQNYNYEINPQNSYHDELNNSKSSQAEKKLTIMAIQDAPIKTENASLFCAVSKNCSSCVVEDMCAWCNSRNSCQSYFNQSMADAECPNKQWYRKQCIYNALTKPCPMRNDSCDDCLSDGLCYWCKSTKQCGYYPHKDFVPPDCPKDDVNRNECRPINHLWVVLLPILCIIFIPIIIYIIIWLVLCCMKQAGYDPLQPEKEQQPKDIEKKKKPIRLQHESMPSKTDELRKKYGLINGEKP